jgi:hypothetical protein
MSWPVTAVVTKQTEQGEPEEIPSKCKVGLVNGHWWMDIVFDKEVHCQGKDSIHIVYKLDKP